MRAYSAVAKQRIPQFMKDDYPALVEFVEAYYEWLDANVVKKNDFMTIRDIDTTLDEYLVFFKDTLAKGLPDVMAADPRIVLKNVKELFSSKGSEKSIKFLFKALFNEDVDVFYPRSQVFHPSDSTWVRQRSIKVSPGDKTADFFLQKELTFTNGKLFVENAFDEEYGTVLFISDVVGDLESISQVKYGNETFAINKQVTKVKVDVPGYGFYTGDTFTVSNGVRLSVKEVTSASLSGLTIVDGGTGYFGSEEIVFTELGPIGKTRGIDAKAIITSVDENGTITGVRLTHTGSLYDYPPGIYCASSDNANGIDATITAQGNFSGIRSVSIENGGENLPGDSLTVMINDAQLTLKYGNVCEHVGYFSDSIGMLSSNTAYLEEEHYYQYFSYVIRSSINVAQYKDVVKALVHPAGMRMLGSLKLSTVVNRRSDSSAWSKMILSIQESLSKKLNLQPDSNRIELLIKSYDRYHWYVHRNSIENRYRPLYLNESTYMNRFANEVIRDWCEDPEINPYWDKETKIQPDAVVRTITP